MSKTLSEQLNEVLELLDGIADVPVSDMEKFAKAIGRLEAIIDNLKEEN